MSEQVEVLQSDTRWVGALFLIMGFAIAASSLLTSGDGAPLSLGLLFLLIGLIFGSTKTVTVLDEEREELTRNIWRLFFVRGKEVSVPFSLVDDVTTGLAAQRGFLQVKLNLADGRTLWLGRFPAPQAKFVVQCYRRAMKIDQRTRRELEASGSLDLDSIEGLKIEKRGDSLLIIRPGVSGSFPLFLALLALSGATFLSAFLWETQVTAIAYVLSLSSFCAATILWRRSQPVTLRIEPKNGLSLLEPSLFGAEQTKIEWAELHGVSVDKGWTNRRFFPLPTVEFLIDAPRSRFGDGLSTEDCQKLRFFILDQRPAQEEATEAVPVSNLVGLFSRVSRYLGVSLADAIGMVKLVLISALVGGVLLSLGAPYYWSRQGDSVYTPATAPEIVKREVLPEVRFPLVTHLIGSGDSVDKVTAVSPLGLSETFYISEEGGYTSRRVLPFGLVFLIGIPLFGWGGAFLG